MNNQYIAGERGTNGWTKSKDGNQISSNTGNGCEDTIWTDEPYEARVSRTVL
jgi:hypothetical protein